MGTRSRAAVAAFVLVAALGGSRTAAADPKGDINTKVKEAMEAYDLMDYDAAKKTLGSAVATAKKAKLDHDPVAAKIWLDLGIVAFAVPDAAAAKDAYTAAVNIDPKIQIDAAYRSPDMAKLLDEVRKGAKGGALKTGGGEPPVELPDGDCSSVKGLQHNILDTSRANAPAAIEAMLGTDINAAKVSLQFRAEGATDFTEVKLAKAGCKYTGAIPASATHGSIVHYFVAAYDGNNKVIAAKGSAGSPNILELTGGGTVKGDEEDPLGKHGGGGGQVAVAGGGNDGIVKGVDAMPGTRHKVMLGVQVGSGAGYVTGQTENMAVVKNCCIGASLAVVTPELTYAVNDRTSVGLAARLGIPVGANTDGHATVAPGGLLRLHYALAASGDGVRVMGQAGVGILRNTIKLDAPMNGGDTDIVAQGPLLLGGGLGYSHHLSNNVLFTVDLSVLAGIAVTSTFSSAPILNSGVSADVSLGLAVGL